MSEQNNIDYIYQDTNEANFQLVSEDLVNQLVRYHNVENQEVTAWFLT